MTLPYLIEPWNHQKDAIARAAELDEFALFFEMGAGKTMTAINILRHKYLKHRRPLRTLILCPLIVTDNWKREWLAHSKLDPKKIEVLTGPGVKRAEKLSRTHATVIITNYEGLLLKEFRAALKTWKIEAIVLDESHRCKDPSAKRSKYAYELADQTMYRYILSGSPILNSPLDLFQQFKILDRGDTFGTNFFAFRHAYFFDRNSGMPAAKHFPDWALQPGAEGRLNQKLQAKSMTVKKKDCLDLPPLVKEVIRVDLSKTQRKLYEEMKRDFITFMEGKAVTATLAITKALRLLQITSGYVVAEGEDGRESLEIKDNPRALALRELLAELTPHHKVIVWAVFKENYRTIKKILDALGVGYCVVTGEVDQVEKMAAVQRFQSDRNCRVFLGNPGAGGIGINLVEASYSIFYSRTFSLEHDLQAEARNHRGGSEIHEKVTRIDLVAKDTLDENVLLRLAQKVEVGHRVLTEIAVELKDGRPGGDVPAARADSQTA